MEKIFKILDFLLKLLLIISVCGIVITFIAQSLLYDFVFDYVSSEPFVFLGKILSFLLIISIVLNCLAVVIGIIYYVLHRKVKEQSSFAKKVIVKGIVWGVVNVLLFFILSILLSFFGLSYTGTHLPTLPRENDYPTGGFPIQELQILEVKQITPCTDGYCYCDVTIKNNSSTLTAVNVSLNQPNGSEYVDSHNQIPPNSILTIQGADTEENACQGFSIQDAGLLQEN